MNKYVLEIQYLENIKGADELAWTWREGPYMMHESISSDIHAYHASWVC